MRFTKIIPLALLLSPLLASIQTRAMPNFARKYGFECSMCHTTVPRVNQFGYNFRKAGFRIPEEIGQEQKMTMDSAFSARIQVLYQYLQNRKYGGTPLAPVRTNTTNNQFTVLEVTLYPLTGSWGKYYGSMTELSIASDEAVEVENAYVRFSYGHKDSWFNMRFGVFHPFEGYGGSDRPFSLSRPLFQNTSADNSGALNNSTGKTLFTPWGFDQAGMELAYVYKNATFSATVFNGMATEDGLDIHPASGGGEQKIAGQSTKNSKDFQLFFNYAFKKDGSGISAYYYDGHTTLPDNTTTPLYAFSNNYSRAAIYGNWMIVKKFGVQAGYQEGRDNYWNTFNLNGTSTFSSSGYFGEIYSPIMDKLTIGLRYDNFDPSHLVAHNTKTAWTLYANAPFQDGMQIVGDYKRVTTQRYNGLPDTTDNNFNARLIWIW